MSLADGKRQARKTSPSSQCETLRFPLARSDLKEHRKEGVAKRSRSRKSNVGSAESLAAPPMTSTFHERLLEPEPLVVPLRDTGGGASRCVSSATSDRAKPKQRGKSLQTITPRKKREKKPLRSDVEVNLDSKEAEKQTGYLSVAAGYD